MHFVGLASLQGVEGWIVHCQIFHSKEVALQMAAERFKPG